MSIGQPFQNKIFYINHYLPSLHCFSLFLYKLPTLKKFLDCLSKKLSLLNYTYNLEHFTYREASYMAIKFMLKFTF